MMELLKTLCSIHAPSGEEERMTEFLLNYIQQNQSKWKTKPQIFSGEDFQHCIVLVFGQPRTAVYAHIDNIGFMTRYQNQLVKIGGPSIESGDQLYGYVKGKKALATVHHNEEKNSFSFESNDDIPRGTSLSYLPLWNENEDSVQCSYIDNRLGVYNALRLCETLSNGAIVFSCWEEHGGGSVPYLSKFLYENYKIKKALISDITWVTDGVKHGQGVAISIRDTSIPRRSFVNEIISLAEESKIPFQLEVESAGGSDGTELQKQPYPIDWCFIGAPEDGVHTPREKVFKSDIESMLALYRFLMEKL